jgi:high-affinity Fe2+/Pb2+ permease
MKIEKGKSSRRRGQVIVRTVIGIAMATAGVLAYLLSRVNQLEAVLVPGILLGLAAFGVALYSRMRYRQQWSAAWEAYAQREIDRGSLESAGERTEIFFADRNELVLKS